MATAKKNDTAEKKTTAKRMTAKKPAVKSDEAKKTVFEVLAESYPVGTAHVDIGNGIAVDVRSRIGMGEALMLIQNIADACVDENRGEVHFEVFDYVTKLSICSVYCGIEAPSNVEVGYAAVCGANRMYDQIAGYIDEDQLSMIWGAAREKIQSKRDLFNSAAAKITVEMVQRMNEIYETMKEMSDGFSGEDAIDALNKLSALAR